MKLEIQDLSFSYSSNAQDRKIIDNLSFTVSEGNLVSLVGPNGVGKSTLLRCMLGLLEPDKGQILLDGVDIATMPAREFWTRVAYVPQMHRSSFAMSVIETVVMGRSARIPLFALPSEKDYAAAREALVEVGISELEHRSFDKLSGGQQRLALIAKALASDPQLLVLDEPETGLDYRNRLIILGLLERLVEERGIAVVMATHYPENAIRASGKALLLEETGAARFGTCEEILSTRTMTNAFNADVRVEKIDVDGKPFGVIVPVSTNIPERREE